MTTARTEAAVSGQSARLCHRHTAFIGGADIPAGGLDPLVARWIFLAVRFLALCRSALCPVRVNPIIYRARSRIQLVPRDGTSAARGYFAGDRGHRADRRWALALVCRAVPDRGFELR